MQGSNRWYLVEARNVFGAFLAACDIAKSEGTVNLFVYHVITIDEFIHRLSFGRITVTEQS